MVNQLCRPHMMELLSQHTCGVAAAGQWTRCRRTERQNCPLALRAAFQAAGYASCFCVIAGQQMARIHCADTHEQAAVQNCNWELAHVWSLRAGLKVNREP